jgi:chromosome segregation ATPase
MAAKPEEGAAETRTTIDTLMELLRAKGKMDVNDIAGTLGIAPSIVESWAKVLETGGMVRISYEVGRMFVAPITISAEQAKLIESKIEVRRGLEEDKIAAQRSEIEKFAGEINSLSTEVSSLERIYQQRMPAVQQMLSQINALYDGIIEQGRSVERIKKGAEDSYQSVNRNIEEMFTKINALSTTDISAKRGKGPTAKETAGTQDALKNASAAYDAFNSLTSVKDRLFDSLLQNVDAQTGALKKHIADRKKEVDAQMEAGSASMAQMLNRLNAQTRESRDLVEKLRTFKKDIESSKRVINNAKVQFTDRYEKIEETMKSSSDLLAQNSKSMLQKLDDLRSAFGDVVKVDSTLHEARKSISAMNKDIESSRETVIELQKTLQALATATVTPEERINTTTEVERKVDKNSEKISKVKKEMENTRGKLYKEE